MLLLADRAYFGAKLWLEFLETKAMLLWRIQKNAPVDVVEKLPDGSYKALLRHDGSQTELRLVVYNIEDSEEPIRLVTNNMDYKGSPAIELARLYPQRWEAELIFDEIKTHLNEARLSIRSKKPDLVKQEIWGLMLLHWALRDLMHDAAVTHARDPDSLSFVRTVRLVKLRFSKDGAFSP
jgi:IS4 transposase